MIDIHYGNNNIYQMDDFNFIVNHNPFNEPPKILKAGEKIQITSNIDIIEQINSKARQSIKKDSDDDIIECDDKVDNEFLRAVKYVYEMDDEDCVNDNEDLKEQQKIDKEKQKWESKRLAELHSASNKFKNERKALVQQYIADGYDEKIIKICKECQLKKPKHPLFYPLNTNQKQIEAGWVYGLVCLDCVESYEDKKKKKELDRKSKCFAFTCKCGIQLTINETSKLQTEAYEKHKQTKHHKQYDMIIENKENSDIVIDFNLFSIAQLRYIIKTNKTDKGKCLVSNYATMKKTDIVKVLDENRDYINISLDILKMINVYKK
jgi:hypothetical protein